jgi:hypothetical protein
MARICFFLFFIHFCSYSQKNIDNSKIEKYCFELHNQLRDSTRHRTVNKDCKKASDYQVDYLFNNHLITHSNSTPGYEKPVDRFEKFMSEKVTVKDRFNPKTIHTHLKYEYDGEIATWSKGYEFLNDSLLEFNIAKHIITNFKNSKSHFQRMIQTSCCDFKQNGYFSTRVRILRCNEDTKMIRLEIYCVAIFGKEYPYRDFYVYDPETGKFID